MKQSEQIKSLVKIMKDLTPESTLEFALEAVKQANREREDADQRAEQYLEKAKTYDRVASVERWFSMQEVAAVLGFKGVGQNKLFSFLRSEGILMNTSNRWNLPYRQYEERGYFKVVEYQVDLGDGNYKNTLKTVVAQKGMDFIRRRLSEANNDEPVEN